MACAHKLLVTYNLHVPCIAGSSVRHSLSKQDLGRIVRSTAGYSASDLTALCREAALGPVRELGAAIASASLDSIRPLKLSDFSDALQVGWLCFLLFV
jgi:SpoVK/Ycf46/Vps4 family AAA+-type ATPase